MMNRGSSVRHWLDDACNQQNIVLNTVLEASQLVTIGQMVAADLGIAVVPALCKEQMQTRVMLYSHERQRFKTRCWANQAPARHFLRRQANFKVKQ